MLDHLPEKNFSLGLLIAAAELSQNGRRYLGKVIRSVIVIMIKRTVCNKNRILGLTIT
jgi:hypothetical protein